MEPTEDALDGYPFGSSIECARDLFTLAVDRAAYNADRFYAKLLGLARIRSTHAILVVYRMQ